MKFVVELTDIRKTAIGTPEYFSELVESDFDLEFHDGALWVLGAKIYAPGVWRTVRFVKEETEYAKKAALRKG